MQYIMHWFSPRAARGTPDISGSLELYLVMLSFIARGALRQISMPPALFGVGVDDGFLNLQLNLLMLLSTEVLVDPFFFSSFPVRTFQC